METFGIYSLKAGLILILFWGVYCLLLKKETFYRFNRHFLLTGLFAALLLPLVIIRYKVEIAAPSDHALPIAFSETISETATANRDGNFPFLNFFIRLLPVLYLTVFSVLLIIRSAGLVRLIRVIRHNKSRRFAGYILIESSEFDGAFSFFRFVFIPLGLNEVEKQIILKHENAHIEQYHWIDLFLSNALCFIWWFNPVMRFYDKAIRDNHEFLADRETLTDYQPEVYQRTLINQWFKTPVFPITHSFAHTNYLIRIIMMKKNFSNPFKQLFAFLTVPVLALFLMAFSEKEYVVLESHDEITAETPVSQNDSTPERVNNQYHFNFETNLSTNKPLVFVNGKEVENLAAINPKEIGSITVLKNESATDLFGDKGKFGVAIISTRAGKNGVLLTSTEVVSSENDVVSFNETIRVKSNEAKKNYIMRSNTFLTNNPLIMIDDEEVSDMDEFKKLDPKDIESITVLKDKTAIDAFGEKGANGVVLITTKNAE